MSRFESVPNFSEGRDPAKVESIVAEARRIPGVTVLDVELNADHHRSVVSLVGPGDALVEALVGMARVAMKTIDLTTHVGEHPRMGAVDVIPFVPLDGAGMDEAVAWANRLGERLWTELGLPVYLYGAAARRPERADLAVVRKGQFEGLREAVIADPARAPDFGERRLHPTAGAVAVGARPVLIAYNAYLTTPDVAVAKKVAHALRARDGGLVEVKALGFDIAERHRAQVSMNLTDYRKTPIHRALEQARREAARYGAAIEESEIVGLVPEDALLDAAEYYLQLNRFDRGQLLDRKVRAAASGGALAGGSLGEFVRRLAARTPTPGGGSAAAAAAAMGAALGEMVLAYSLSKEAPDPEILQVLEELKLHREALLSAVDADATAYEAVRAARKRAKEAPGTEAAGVAAALRTAAEVPLETARTARHSATLLGSVRGKVKATVASDLTTALALLRAAVDGALANVEINLQDLAAAKVPHDDLVRARDELSRGP